MNKITFDNKDYNPYTILQVSENDTDEHVAKAFRQRIKRYHPDKAPIEKVNDYKKKYDIVYECYEFIKQKRKSVYENDTSQCNENKWLENKTVDEIKRTKSIQEYKDYKPNIVKQFNTVKFNKDRFNTLFEYLNDNPIPEEEFDPKAYNESQDLTVGKIHKYRGLLVSLDTYEDESDYKKMYLNAPNPTKVIRVNNSKKKIIDKKLENLHNIESKRKVEYDNYKPTNEKIQATDENIQEIQIINRLNNSMINIVKEQYNINFADIVKLGYY